ncbi:MAG: hypothetical protein KIT72_05110 [Polyangiaceae bacterium]|nr:hypothetical protein [Polyangiaceae bacterium]MCW5789783.1 hypothetical protein [Polyangiaceae bacterium]
MSADGANRLALAVYCLLALWVVFRDVETAPAARPNPQSAIPRTSELLVTARLDRLRASPLGRHVRELLRAEQPLGWDDPACRQLEDVDELALGLPRVELGQAFEALYVAFVSPLRPEEWERCARRLAAARGRELDVSHRGGYRRLALAGGAADSGSLAMRDDGLLLWGGAPQVEAMVATAAGHTPSAVAAEDHRVLREIVGVNGALLVSWSGEPGMLLPGVRAAALRVDMGERVELSGVLRCVDETSCEGHLDPLRALAARLGARERGDFKLHDQGEVVRFRLSVPSHDAVRWVDTWLASEPEPTDLVEPQLAEPEIEALQIP